MKHALKISVLAILTLACWEPAAHAVFVTDPSMYNCGWYFHMSVTRDGGGWSQAGNLISAQPGQTIQDKFEGYTGGGYEGQVVISQCPYNPGSPSCDGLPSITITPDQ